MTDLPGPGVPRPAVRSHVNEVPARAQAWRLRKLDGISRILFPWNLLWDQRLVLVTLVRSQIDRRHRRSLLGWSWNIIQPGSQAIVLYVATRGALRLPQTADPLVSFGIFFAAYIIGQGMGEIVSRGPTLVAERSTWVKGSLFPLELLAPTAVGVALYRIVPGGLLGVAAVTIGAGLVPGLATLVAFLVGLALAVVWGTTLALLLSAVGVYVRDAVLAAPILTLATIFVSPLYIAPDAGGLLELARNLNPLTVPMELVLNGLGWIPANLLQALVGVASALLAIWLVALWFRRAAARFADYV